jgi:hypothetical protein
MKAPSFFAITLMLTTGAALHVAVASAQAQTPRTQRLGFAVKLASQAYGLPFQNLADGFTNPGASAVVDYAYNQRQNLAQTLQIGVQSHAEQGNMYFVNTQVAYRPTLWNHLQPGVALGVGRVYAFANPRNAYYKQDGSGSWRKSDQQRQGHWQVPLTLSLGYKAQLPSGVQLTPFVDYQITPLISYNDGFPVLPYGLLSVGTRFQLRS